ncbi:MAG: hypothetical protein LBS96_01700 [Oscillospiraceae bacterium]|jgi:hypothetical protein|nr:hypothetical protein [Oscillospiraceae bacterium]
MSQGTVLGQLRLLTELDDEAARAALPFCAAALAQLHPLLRSDANPDDPRIDRAAAGIAYCLVLQRAESRAAAEEDAQIESFKAGDITVRKRGEEAFLRRIERAERLRAEGLAAVAELLRDRGFAVRTTAFHTHGGAA